MDELDSPFPPEAFRRRDLDRRFREDPSTAEASAEPCLSLGPEEDEEEDCCAPSEKSPRPPKRSAYFGDAGRELDAFREFRTLDADRLPNLHSTFMPMNSPMWKARMAWSADLCPHQEQEFTTHTHTYVYVHAHHTYVHTQKNTHAHTQVKGQPAVE